MFKLAHDELQTILAQLDQAIYYHEQWSRGLYRALICRLLSDQRDVRPDAHRHCLFGQWYYNHAPERLHDHPAFRAIADEHQHMHERAARLFGLSANDETITPRDYDAFAASLERMRLQIFTLKRELEDSLHNLDPLTGASSRIGMLTKLREQQELVRRKVQSCCIAMLDLDHFKEINDVHGHAVGDRVLIAAVRYLLDHLRPYDTVFRYGGEEFVIVMQNMDQTQGHALVERLREGVAATPVEIKGREAIRCTVSFGLTLLDPDEPVEHSIDRADKALYAAKTAGRNCTRIWDASM